MITRRITEALFWIVPSMLESLSVSTKAVAVPFDYIQMGDPFGRINRARQNGFNPGFDPVAQGPWGP